MSPDRAAGEVIVPGLSVAIIARDEAHRIAACLATVAFADQIVVLDSGSTDDTVAIARRLGAEVVITDWPGFGIQKNRALAACRHHWVLSLDADEALTDALAAEIQAVVAARPAGAGATAPVGYWIRRHSRFCGQLMRHGLWGNDRVLRLFERRHARFTDDRVHERAIVDGPTATLAGILMHESVDSLADAHAKARLYASLGARTLIEGGRRVGPVSAALRGSWTFIRGYFLKRGFLDGRNGLILAWISARGTWWKYRWTTRPPAMDSDGR